MVHKARVLMVVAVFVSLFATVHAAAATEFYNSAFRAAYYAGEAITPNFWGPLEHASDPRVQDYRENPAGPDNKAGERVVQYFDKGRMEWTKGQLTFGLLATEMVTGRIQVGDNSFIDTAPSNTPVAGDENGEGPSYATLHSYPAMLAATSNKVGQPIYLVFDDKTLYTDRAPDPALPRLTDYDGVTGHNVLRQFTDYRNLVGFSTIGYARSEPAAAFFTVGGVQRVVAFQVFERRVLTYTPDNPPNFRVEMGNIGRHYFYWRNPR
jgi:hypothetical protein